MMQNIIQQEHGSLSLTKAYSLTDTHNQKNKPQPTKLIKEIYDIAAESPSYGYRRITKELQRRKYKVNHKRILAIMHENWLKCKKKAFRICTTNSNHNNPIYPNLAKEKKVNGMNEVWAADITYVPLANGENAYLATVIDLFSRKCIGWQLSRNIDTQLCLDALNMALNERKNMNLTGLIHHSDRGTQYTSFEYTTLLEEQGIEISMSRKGNPYDNAFAESFFKTIKYEEVFMNEYNSFNEAYENIEHFIEEVYNNKRLHSAIGYQPPAEFEQKIIKEIGA